MHCSLVLRDGFAHLVVLLKIDSKIAAAHRIFGIDARRSLEMRMRLFFFILENQRPAEIVLRDEIVFRDRERVRPQIDAALPVVDLAMSRERESQRESAAAGTAGQKPYCLDFAQSAAPNAIITKIPISGM